jgi:nucleoside-triphosphatase THEP1
MEIVSPRFCDLVLEVFDSLLIVVATVMERYHPFADRLRGGGMWSSVAATLL